MFTGHIIYKHSHKNIPTHADTYIHINEYINAHTFIQRSDHRYTRLPHSIDTQDCTYTYKYKHTNTFTHTNTNTFSFTHTHRQTKKTITQIVTRTQIKKIF